MLWVLMWVEVGNIKAKGTWFMGLFFYKEEDSCIDGFGIVVLIE